MPISHTVSKVKGKDKFLEKIHEEISTLVQSFEDNIGRLQPVFKSLMQHCNRQINMESIEDLLGVSHGDENSAPMEIAPQMHSSTSTHDPCLRKVTIYRNIQFEINF